MTRDLADRAATIPCLSLLAVPWWRKIKFEIQHRMQISHTYVVSIQRASTWSMTADLIIFNI